MKVWTVVFAMALALTVVNAEAARRLGGGGSVGKQSDNVTQRQGTAPAQQPGAAAQQPGAAPAAAAAPQAPRSRWGGMVAGLAAGLGLAWLAHSLGLGEAFGQFLLFALLALAVMAVVGLVLRSRRAPPTDRSGGPGYAYQGAAAAAEAPMSPPQYSPDKVGNDASARPWERNSMAFEAGKIHSPGEGLRIGSGLAGRPGWGIPDGFDVQGFVDAAKRNFITLQDAWDRSDIPALRSMMTDAMLHEIRTQLAERDKQAASPNRTEVVLLEAQLLGIEDLGVAYMASVEFSGLIREEPSSGPSPFREVWNMTKPKDGSAGWLVAGVQALQ